MSDRSNLPRPAPSTDADLAYLSIGEAAALYRSRQLSPVELTRVILDRIERLNPSLNAYLTVTAESALAQAQLAEQELFSGTDRGPLHGIPLGVKDLYDTAGVRTTAGSQVLSDNVPSTDATAVGRLRQAGAVIVGKQHMQEFANSFSRVSPFFGEIHNPWNLDCVPGGSSGGTASAIAAGLCLGGLGSDTGGSIRVPAAFCGISGIKPTHGRVSLQGVTPLSWTFDHAGPLARSAADCALLLNAVAGYDSADVDSIDRPADDYADPGKGIAGLRVGIVDDFLEDPLLDQRVTQAFQKAAEALREQGALLSTIRLPNLEDLRSTFPPIFRAERAAFHASLLAARAEHYGPGLAETIREGASVLATAVVNAHRLRRRSIRTIDHLLERYDALLAPTTPIAVPTIAQVASQNHDLPFGRFTLPFNVLGLPALSVPCGFDEQGLPIGLMIVGRRWDERTVLRIGQAYQRVTDWHRRRPSS